MKEIQMSGFVYQVEWTHSGQYRPYGDTFRVAEIKTEDTNPQSILELMRVFFRYDVPLKENWGKGTMAEYFAGWCTVEPIEGGFRYTKCEPWTD